MTDVDIEKILIEFRRYAEEKKSDVAKGKESPQTAATAIRAYGTGLAKSVDTLHDHRLAVMVIYETDKLADEIDDL